MLTYTELRFTELMAKRISTTYFNNMRRPKACTNKFALILEI